MSLTSCGLVEKSRMNQSITSVLVNLHYNKCYQEGHPMDEICSRRMGDRGK